ncbi:MAG: hypothetical protein GX587_14230 [Bacteroidales bacterium]|nr:hypothetical protein [Bacteroidales bacterium]
MKRTKNISFLISVCLLFIWGCNKTSTVEFSECKNFETQPKSGILEIGSDSSCIYYNYNEEEKTLSIKHINAGFNCCPKKIYFDFSIENDTIFISEKEKESGCDCICLYDLDYSITDIAKQSYCLYFKEPYCDDQAKHIFSINLNENISGSHCVERTYYPWGI